MTEHTEQQALFEWAALDHTHPELSMLFAVPNGGKRAIFTAVNLKAEGVKPGVPDVWLPVPRNPYCGLVIEMKYGKNAVETNQKRWLTALSGAGWSCHVCYSFEAARMVLLWYLSLERPSVVTEKVHTWKGELDFDLYPKPPGLYT